MAEEIRVVVADDHALFRQGLVGLINAQPHFVVVGDASSGPEAVDICRDTHPDVVLMDVHMPEGDGIQAVVELRNAGDFGILMLTISDKDEDLMSAIRAGADGYLLKNAEPRELFRAIGQVAEGLGALSPEITGKVMQTVATSRPGPASQSITARELEVLSLIARGATTAEIAQQLVISASTVKTHVRNIFRKLKAGNRAEAVARAVALGLIPD